MKWFIETWDPRVRKWIRVTQTSMDYDKVTNALRRLQTIGLKCRIRKDVSE